MRLTSVLAMAMLAVPLLAAAQTPTPLDVLQKDSVLVQSLFERDARSTQIDRDEQTREESNDLLPAMAGGEVPMTMAQKNVLKRCEKVTQLSQKKRCDIIKCRLLGECRGR